MNVILISHLHTAAGYDVVLVETVGVGQSETMVNDMVDFFTLLVPPNSGDELQGLKKGIVELCDMVIVNKADGKMLEMANITMTEYLSALKYVRRKSRDWSPQVQKVSSVQETGLVETWKTMMDYYNLSRVKCYSKYILRITFINRKMEHLKREG